MVADTRLTMKMALSPTRGKARAASNQCIEERSQASIARKCSCVQGRCSAVIFFLSHNFPYPLLSLTRSFMSNDYLKRILNSKVYDVAVESPLESAPLISARIQNKVWLKREDAQEVFSFKLRGAYNKMANLSAAELKRGVIAASAGNHAQGVALSARKLGCRAVIVMPTTTPRLKVDAVQALGGEAVLAGDSYSDAYAHAMQLEKK